MLKIKTIFVSIFIFIMLTTTAYATSISLVPTHQEVTLGDNLVLELSLDFSDDPTIGGGIDIFYNNSILDFLSFEFDGVFGDDPDFRIAPTDLPGEIDGLSFGNFLGISGPTFIGTLTFNTLDVGFTSLSLAENDTNAGGFYSAVTFAAQNVTFEGATANIVSNNDPAPVPEPSTFLLLGVSLVGLIYRKK